MGNLTRDIDSRFNQYSRILLRWRRLFYAAIGFPLVFTIVFSLLAKPQYLAKGRLLPTSDAANIGVMGFLSGFFRAQGGGMVDGAPSSFLYVDILKSQCVIEKTLNAQYGYYKGNNYIEGDLYKLMHWSRNTTAIDEFRNTTTTKMDVENGIITITAKAHNPALAAQIVNNWIRMLDDFNRNVRVTQAGQNLQYLERRIKEAEDELKVATDTLVKFLNANRGYPQSTGPEVQTEVRKLENTRDIKESVHKILSEEYEMAKLVKEKTTPIVSILDSAIPPSEKWGPKRLPVFAISFFFALIILSITLSIIETRYPTKYDTRVLCADVKDAFKEDGRTFISLFRRHR